LKEVYFFACGAGASQKKKTPDATGVASGRCKRKVTRAMKIEKYFDKQIGQDMWRIDVTVNNRRHRRGQCHARP